MNERFADSEFYYVPICGKCRHYNLSGIGTKKLNCDAYPNGIPSVILTGEVDHRKPYKGDHGIRFESKEKKSWKGFY